MTIFEVGVHMQFLTTYTEMCVPQEKMEILGILRFWPVNYIQKKLALQEQVHMSRNTAVKT